MTPATSERISAGCYGSLIAASTLIGLGEIGVGELIVIVVLTNIVYYATHVFAYSIGDTDIRSRGAWQTVTHHLTVSAPMVSVCFAPLIIVLILTAVGLEQPGPVVFGVIGALVVLVGVATSAAYLRRLHPVAIVLTAVITLALSGALIWAKLLLH
jgi:hypothetical protein